MPVNIHGKQYFTVAERIDQAISKDDLKGVTTEIISQDERRVVVKATIVTKNGTFTGMSESDPSKSIERQNPVEVAETSAVGRALAFAGYNGGEIASADEMQKALAPKKRVVTPENDVMERHMTQGQQCKKCGAEMVKNPKTGKWFCKDKCWLKQSDQVAEDAYNALGE